MKTIKYLISFFIISILFTVAGCSDDLDKGAIPPTSEDATFSYSFDPENPNKVYFTAEPAVSTWYTHWSFGDNTAYDKGLETSKVYLKKGEYEVKFKIFTEGGTASFIQTIIIESDFEGPNILRNGAFDDGNEFWTVLPISDGVDVSFDNNEAHWTGGGWGQVGIYQPIHVLANNLYQMTMDINISGLSDSWFEVYVGMEAPVIGGPDYSDGGMRLALNTWDGCGSEPFEGDFSEISCVGSGATFKFSTEGTAYLVIRGGGADYGDIGVILDNIAIRSLESTAPPIYPTLGSPEADFTFEVSDLTAIFTNSSTDATSYSWDFGDNAGTSTDANPSYTYAQEGTYTVELTASNSDESSITTKELTVTQPAASTSIQNGDFSDTSAWTIIKQNGSENGSLKIENGVAVFDEAIDVASGSWGSEAHMGMYQAVEVISGDYQFDMDITTNGIDEVWLDVWVGTSKPIDGVEYKDDVGATKILSFNAWDCGETNKTYTGKMAAASCSGDGTISLEPGIYYIMIRSGGFTFGEGGIVIDNVTMETASAQPSPVADFTVTTTDLAVTFTNTSTNATSYSWDFGDNAGTSTDENPVYTYASEGTYTVKLTASNDNESVEVTKDVTVSNTAPVNLISNGTFSDDSGWTIINIDATDNGVGSVTIADGVAKFSETATDPWKHWAIYTAVTLEAGTYQFDMDMTYAGIDAVWGEVYIGATQPTDNSGVDYNGDQQVLKAFNAWECDNIKTYSGSAVAGGCDTNDNPGQFEITTAGTYYLLFRTGGSQWGAEGIVIDNVSLSKTN